MNDAQAEEQKARIQALADEWIKPVGLGWWGIDIDYERGPLKVNGKLEPETIAATTVDWRYGQANISFCLPNVADQSDADLERCFVHELMHIFLNEMRWARDDDADHLDHEERVASTLTKAFLWLRDHLTPTDSYPLSDDIVIDPRTQQLMIEVEASPNGAATQPAGQRAL